MLSRCSYTKILFRFLHPVHWGRAPVPQIKGDLMGNKRSCGMRRSLDAIDMADNADVRPFVNSDTFSVRNAIQMFQGSERLEIR